MTKGKPKLAAIDSRKLSGSVKSCLAQLKTHIDNGQAVGVAMVITKRDGTIDSFYEAEMHQSLIGAIEYLKSRIIRESIRESWDRQ